MVDKKITALNNITGANLADTDEFVVVDISADETMAVTRAEFFKNTPSIGIGTAAPSAKLTAYGNGAVPVRWGDTSSLGTLTYSGSDPIIQSNTGNMLFYGGASERMRIDSSGNVIVANRGTDAAPVLRFSTDVSSGIFSPAAGQFAFTSSGTESMRIDASGNLRVANTSTDLSSVGGRMFATGAINAVTASATCFSARRLTTNGTVMGFVSVAGDTVGTISTTASATAYNTSSDYRLKENIAPVQGAADIVKAMRPCTYTFKSDGSWHDGFLAHELQELHPRAVTGEKDAMKDEEYEVTPAVLDEDGAVVTEAVMGTRSVPDYQGVDYSKLTPILTAALQEALNKIDALEARLIALESL